MTIAVAIRTGSAVIFAADSKVTTQGLAGFEADGSPRWVSQTYDNATKVIHDVNKSLMAMVAGNANVGQFSATDFLSRYYLDRYSDPVSQDQAVSRLVEAMVEQKRRFWSQTQVSPDQWPGPIILLASPGPGQADPRVWHIDLRGASSNVQEILTFPNVYLEGSYNDAFTLLYGVHLDVLAGLAGQIGVPEQQVEAAWNNPQGFLRPIDRINFAAMPTQDAIDLAVFLADVQIQMDRFLPGEPACGGPIDVMVLVMAPNPDILAYPGKTLHHPHVHRVY